MSAITAKASRKMKKYAVLTREPRCFLGSFDFSWEQRKLGDIADIVGGGTPSTGNQSYWDGDIDWYAPAEIADQIYANSSQKKITGLGYKNSSAKMLPPGTVLFTSRAGIGKTAILTRKGCTNQGFQSIVPHRGELDSYFIFSRTEELKRYGELVGAGSTFVEVSGKQMAVMELMMPPTMREQQTIGGFFQQLDHLITLHQRKCANLCSPSQVVFSLLFATSTFSWEQRKVSDLAEKTYGGGTPTTSNEAYWNGDIPWIQSSDVVDGKLLGVEPRKWITQDGLNNSAAQLIPGNSIAIITRVGVGKLAFMPYSYATSQDFLSLSKLNAEPLFTVYACYKKLQSELNAVQGTSIKGITKDELLAKNIMVPRYAEQQQIGAFFKQLDNLITLHQRECISFTGRADRLILTANKKRTTSSWEQRKLGDVVKEIIRNDPESEAPIMMITANNGFIEQSERYAFNNAGESLKKYILLKKGELAYNHGASKLRPYGSCFALTTAENARIPFVYHCFSAENQNAEFMSIELNGAEIENQLRKIVSSGARMDGLLNISFDEYTSVSVLLPGTEEQDCIADFFRHLDNLITLHQRKPFLMKWRTSDANRNQTNRLVL